VYLSLQYPSTDFLKEQARSDHNRIPNTDVQLRTMAAVLECANAPSIANCSESRLVSQDGDPPFVNATVGITPSVHFDYWRGN